MENWLDIQGRVVIVTGGSNGIGKSIAAGLREAGAITVAADLRPPADGAEDYFPCDVTKQADVERLMDAVHSRFGRIDALVNNAGVNRPGLLVDTKQPGSRYEVNEADYALTMDVDVKGVVLASQAAARKMIAANKGVIVNISSTSGQPGSVGQSLYAAAKAAVNSLTRSWGKELGKYGIRVVAVTPGIHEKTLLNSSDAYLDALAYTRGKTRDQVDDNYTSSIPLGRVGTLSEIADLVCYLISDRASYITGTVVNVSGGKTTA